MTAYKQLTVKMPEKDVMMVEELVRRGHAMSTADFIRRAIREKCDDIGVKIEHDKTVQTVFPVPGGMGT